MSSTLKITITNSLETEPQQGHMSHKLNTAVQWKCHNRSESYTLSLPGNVFAGHPDPFQMLVIGSGWSDLLELLPDAPATVISDYIHNPSGKAAKKKAGADPPEVIVESGPGGGGKPPNKTAADPPEVIVDSGVKP